jgi:hypothetical protein
MAKTSYVEVIPEIEDQFFLGIRSADRFVHARLVRKPLLFSVKRKKEFPKDLCFLKFLRFGILFLKSKTGLE